MEYTLKELSKYVDKKFLKKIDEEMIPILIELNSKGYKTIYCCQGHTEKTPYERREQIYIMFKEKYVFNEEPQKYIRQKNSAYGGILKASLTGAFANKTIIEYFTSRNSTTEQKEKERKTIMNMLFEWSKKIGKNEK